MGPTTCTNSVFILLLFFNNVNFRSGTHEDCFRCIQIIARSANVLSLKLQNLKSCYINEYHALDSCPDLHEESIDILLIRKC